jgi:glycosyltransferase involved in cell wall biosynthesis
MRHILVATNNFWVGGRETYSATYLSYLKRAGYRATLIASSVHEETPEAAVFDRRLICGSAAYAERWRAWLERAEELFAADRPSLVWAHHFDLFPAWLISKLYRVPLLTTFHGPLIGAGNPNDPMQSLGMALAIHRGEAVSGVSQEIISGLRRLKPDRDEAHLLPNAIEVEQAALARASSRKPRKFVLVTRPEKLGHIREAVLFFSAYLRKNGQGKLTIAAGISPHDKGERGGRGPLSLVSKARLAVRSLGGKWCYDQGRAVVRSLPHISFHGYTANARDLIRGSDVVLGMGRVLLEGLAEGKPCVLVGYNETCGLVSASTFDHFRWSNFSGRGIRPQPREEVCDSLLDYCEKGASLDGDHLSSISSAGWGRRLDELIQTTVRSSNISGDDDDARLATKLAERIRTRRIKSEEIFARVCGNLSESEMSSLYLLSIG